MNKNENNKFDTEISGDKLPLNDTVSGPDNVSAAEQNMPYTSGGSDSIPDSDAGNTAGISVSADSKTGAFSSINAEKTEEPSQKQKTEISDDGQTKQFGRDLSDTVFPAAGQKKAAPASDTDFSGSISKNEGNGMHSSAEYDSDESLSSGGDTAIFSKSADIAKSEKTDASSEAGSEKKPSPFVLFFKRLKKRFEMKSSEEKEDEPVFVPRVHPRPTLLAVFFGVIKILLVIVLLFGIAGMGLLLGIAKAYVDTTPALDISMLTKSDRTSYIYDCNGNMITTFASMEYRDWADIEDIPKRLRDALIAIEDVRFYEHSGLDFKRLFSAVINTLRNSNTHGGSTITQQLIKNKYLSNIQSYKRKIQEAYLAYELESVMEKDDILEAYMNDVYLGDSNYGFKTAAKDYFGKEMNELTIRECAMLAGMVQKPNLFNPRANTYKRFNEDGTNKMDRTNERTDTVINAMYNNGFITLQERNQALNEKVYILEESAQKQLYDMAYYVEYAIYDVVTHLLAQRGLPDSAANRSAIEKELRTGGYRIHLAVDPDIQDTVQETITDWEDYPALRNSSAGSITDPTSGITVVQPQASAVIIDHKTGLIKAIIGGREEPQQKRQLNRAYQSSMPVGSSIKPLSIYGPALDIGGAFPGTGILNAEVPIEGYGGTHGYPALGPKRWAGITTFRRGLTSSLNIVAARALFDIVTPEVSAEYLQELGIDPSRINVDGPGLALGTSGITPLEMAAAYACIANGGVYLEPLSFTTVVSEDGKVILDAAKIQESHRVFKPSTAYMLIDMMKDVVAHGTGKKARIDGITVAGKTGTNEDYTSVYFAGFTGYYTASLWIGHDKYSEKLAKGSTGGNSAAPLWQAFMEPIHEGLSNKQIFDVSPADIGLVQVPICPISGKIATNECFLDEDNPPVYDWCPIDSIPDEYCDMHCCIDYCSASDMPASVNCPSEMRYEKAVVLIPSTSIYSKLPDELLFEYIPNAIRTDLSISEYQSQYFNSIDCCYIHSQYNPNMPLDSLLSQAVDLMNEVNDYLDNVQTLPVSSRKLLIDGIFSLQQSILTNDPFRIYNDMRSLRRNYLILRDLYPPVEAPDN